jgi:hypothetical protein
MNGAFAIGDELLVLNTAIRREYLKLPRDLAALTRSFGIVLSPQLQRDTSALAFAIECTDRLLDAIPEAGGRGKFSTDVLSFFRGENALNPLFAPCALEPQEGPITPSGGEGGPAVAGPGEGIQGHHGLSPDLTPELIGWLARLKEVAERHHVHAEFREITCELLCNSEQMRTTQSDSRFVDCAVREGQLMVELLLLILAEVSTPSFADFMRRLAGPANLGDKLRDARCDYQRGEITIRPTWKFRARLACEMSSRVLRLTGFCIGNARLMTWGICSVCTELFWFRFSRSHSH